MKSSIAIVAVALLVLAAADSRDRSAKDHNADGPILGATPPSIPPTQPSRIDSGFDVRVNQDVSGQPQTETAVAVNPTNPLNIVAAARDRRNGIERNGFYASFDGGATWQDGILTEGTYTYQSDPAVAACADGSFVYASLSFNSNGIGGVFVYRSTDGGLTWPQKGTVISGVSLDKEWIACDTRATSAFANRIYVRYREGPTNGPIKLKYSDDGGQTWSTAVTIADDATNTKNGIALDVGPTGVVYATWFDFATNRIKFDLSSDGPNGVGTFGDGQPAARPNVRDALDESVAICP